MDVLEVEESEELEAIAFVGETLSPLYLWGPEVRAAQTVFDAIAALDVRAAAERWPFVDTSKALRLLGPMADAASGGCDDDLVWEYRRLFVGPGAKAAPPWGSVYTEHECVVFGALTLELRSWMRTHGVRRLTDERTPEDHFGLLLALMAFLARSQPEDLDEFMRLHLLTWSSHFLEGLVKASGHLFYRGLALLTKETLEGIQRERALDVAYPRFYR